MHPLQIQKFSKNKYRAHDWIMCPERDYIGKTNQRRVERQRFSISEVAFVVGVWLLRIFICGAI